MTHRVSIVLEAADRSIYIARHSMVCLDMGFYVYLYCMSMSVMCVLAQFHRTAILIQKMILFVFSSKWLGSAAAAVSLMRYMLVIKLLIFFINLKIIF